MKIFLSWSNDSRVVADALFSVLPRLFDDAEPFVSTETRAGTIWLPELEKELSDTEFGIVCVTRQNMTSRWLHYEAGALSRRVGAKRQVMPVFLIDIERVEDVGGPFAGFQLTRATKDGFVSVVKVINELRTGPKIEEQILLERVETYWPTVHAAVESVRSGTPQESVERDPSALLSEILQIVRGLAVSRSAGDWSAIDQSALSEGISNRILKSLSTRGDELSTSWAHFDEAVRRLADDLKRNYPPDFMVGVYPEGGFIGYLLWLDSDRQWPFMLAPDLDTAPVEGELAALGARIAKACEGKEEPRGLVVDAAMKTGRTMRRTVDLVREACGLVGLTPRLETLCVTVRHGYERSPEDRPSFFGLGDGYDLPFGR